MDLKDLSPFVTAGVALYVASTWRTQTSGKRKMELAEQTLTLFYEARDAISDIRNPAGFNTEEDAGERAPHESDAAYRGRQRASIVFTRYKQYAELFGKLQAMRYQSRAVFGEIDPDPFTELRNTLNTIFVSARMLAHLWGREEIVYDRGIAGEIEQHRRQTSDYEATFWHIPDDVVSKRVDLIVESVESICRPVLSPSTISQRLKVAYSTAMSRVRDIG